MSVVLGTEALFADPAREHLPTQLLWAAFGVPKARVIVEVGGNGGFIAGRFVALLAPGTTLWACSTNQVMVQWMQRHMPAEQRQFVKPLQIREQSTGLPDRIAELAYLVNTYAELKDHRGMLAELQRVLVRGGVVAVVDWKREQMRLGPPLSHRVAAGTIAREMEAAGFVDVKQPAELTYHSVVVGKKP